ncbi:MAG: hypothetical protein IID31_13495, partial [Planctomycetes bacterium]|nr:hypothetical protein [Planctomycetota bacterium]
MDLLGARSLPFLSRRNYHYECIHLVPWGVLVGMVEGNIASIVVANTFNGSDFLIATASATPIGSLLFSLAWGMLCAGRPKLRLVTLFGSATALCTATVILTPQTAGGGVLFVIQIAAAQVFLSGVVTVRAALWRHNYPPDVRGRIIARLQAVRMLTTVVVLIGVSALLDYDDGLYRYLYPAASLAGLVGLLILQRVHVRHERSELEGRPIAGAPGSEGEMVRAIRVGKALSPGHVIGEMVRLLRRDRRYTRYLVAHALMGVGVQIVMPVLVIVLSGAFQLYWISVVLIEIIPKLTMFGSLGRWGRWFDRIPVTRFRVHTGIYAAGGVLFGMAATWVITTDWLAPTAALPLAVMLFAARSVAHGLQRGGGSLAWNLGHLHFSRRHDAELYMGVHVSLTGLRGL